MPYVVEVDQSIKVEDTGDTFLAFSDGISHAIKIPFSVKQKGLQALRNRGKPKKRASFESERIEIRAIGKKSPADELAGAVRRGKREADRTITAEELLSVVG